MMNVNIVVYLGVSYFITSVRISRKFRLLYFAKWAPPQSM